MILIKSEEEIKMIRESCQIVAEVLQALKGFVSEGVTTKDIEGVAEDAIIKRGGIPAFKGYRGYPSNVCTSVNDQIVHGIPSGLKLKKGDVVSIDLGVNYKGFFGDAAITLPVGEVSELAKRLLSVTETALYIGISKAEAGRRTSDISNAIQEYVESNGFSVVRAFTGHGIGKFLHEEPQIPNFGPPGKGPKLKEGMTLALEPMVNAGSYEVNILDDGWTAVTKDGSLSAHFEHTIVITKDGAKVLTKSN
ncbi:MAG: type I methionyl aminopeptidase [Nitrospirae bacterium]|nr:type I methionyl aminopeptidase [Nitrospirota bacterium]